jgi:hypothetical protein
MNVSYEYRPSLCKRWFSPGTPPSSITKTGRHDIAEILLKVVLNKINRVKSIIGTLIKETLVQ